MNIPGRDIGWTLMAVLLGMAAGCSGPGPTPPTPHVNGLDTYVAGAEAYRDGDDDKAQTLLQQAVDENPNLIMPHQLLGDLYRKQQNYRLAVEQYQAFVHLDPYSFKGHYDMAVTYQFLHELGSAAEAYLQALMLSPRDLNSNMNLGLVYLAMGKTDDAVKQLEIAVGIDPLSAAAQCNLGVALETAGQLGKAELAYQRATELDPALTVAMIDLGSVLLREGRGQEAAVVLSVAVKKEPTALVHKRLADALLLQHRDEEALAEYDAALRLDKHYWPAMNQIGVIQLRKYQAGLTLDEGLRRSAVDNWKRSLALRGDQPQIKALVSEWDQNGRLTP
jgi:tetratricopeptide (TPR) repeat protein